MNYFNGEEFRKNLPIIKPISSTNSKKKYYNIPFAFDTETTSTYVNGEKFAFMYVWMFGYKYNEKDYIYYGRTWEELLELLTILQDRYHLNEDKSIIVYVHNLAFDFQFMRKYLNWIDVFSVKEKYPVKALCEYGIEFRDSYILSAMSLKKTGENLQKYNVRKLAGDLDYELVRHSKTPLTDKELGYCENDIAVLLAYIQEQIELYGGKLTRVPLTNTGRVREYVRNNCFYTNKTHRKTSKGKYNAHRDLMSELTLDETSYKMLKCAFQGGFTHANYNMVGELLENVHSIDFTSSYPAVMLTEKFPMSKPKLENVETMTELYDLMQNSGRGFLFCIEFTNIYCKIEQEMYISEHKCLELEKPVVNNGRVYSADRLRIIITDIDLRIISSVYAFDDCNIVNNVYSFYMDYLPKPIIESIIDLYEAKTTLKGVKGKEVEYLVKKGMLNSVYGMCVTDIVRDEITYTDDWNIEPADIEKAITDYNENKRRFLFYPWGVWVTAYARKNLWSGILNIGLDYVYSDTDSIKFLEYDSHKDYIKSYNENIEKKLKAMCEYYHIDFNRCKPKNNKGKTKLIGVWDDEGEYTYFKTLGAKKYMTFKEDSNKFELTCAGLSKQNGMDYIKEGRSIKQAFDFFNNHMNIPADRTGKQTHTYIDDEMEGLVTDYLGNEMLVKSLSGIHLEATHFTVDMSQKYLDFLKLFCQEGYLLTEIQEGI